MNNDFLKHISRPYWEAKEDKDRNIWERWYNKNDIEHQLHAEAEIRSNAIFWMVLVNIKDDQRYAHIVDDGRVELAEGLSTAQRTADIVMEEYAKGNGIHYSSLIPSSSILWWQNEVHRVAKEHGWWDTKRPIPELLCLMHSEISEAFEGYRQGDEENFKEELADLAIRLLDMCHGLGVDLEEEIRRKNDINKCRLYRHGDKKC